MEKRCMRVHQRKHQEALAANFGQSEGHVATPFLSVLKCVKGPEEETVGEDERRHFHSFVGSLMYTVVNTRPDVALATGQLVRVVQCPNKEQVAVGMRVAKYLGQSVTVGLQCSAAAQSVGGFICCVGGGPTAWESKKQVDQALSTVEFKYMAIFTAASALGATNAAAGSTGGSLCCCRLCWGQPMLLLVLLGAAYAAAGSAEGSLCCCWFCWGQPMLLLVLLGAAYAAAGSAEGSPSYCWFCLGQPKLLLWKLLLVLLAAVEVAAGATGGSGSYCWCYWRQYKLLLVLLAVVEAAVGAIGGSGRCCLCYWQHGKLMGRRFSVWGGGFRSGAVGFRCGAAGSGAVRQVSGVWRRVSGGAAVPGRGDSGFRVGQLFQVVGDGQGSGRRVGKGVANGWDVRAAATAHAYDRGVRVRGCTCG
ncbi:unnamed protein product [Closterium sp. NIES-54]